MNHPTTPLNIIRPGMATQVYFAQPRWGDAELPTVESAVLNRYLADLARARGPLGRALNSCRHCGATAYKTLMERDALGVMRPAGRYQCVQCRRVFSDVRQWRGSGADACTETARSTA